MRLNHLEYEFLAECAPSIISWLDYAVDLWDTDHGWFEIYNDNRGRRTFKFKVGKSARNFGIIEAMGENDLLWGLSWYSSKKKGRFSFKIETKETEVLDNVVSFPNPVCFQEQVA